MLASASYPATAFAEPPFGSADEPTLIETRFGTVEIGPDNVVRVAGGLLGFEGHRDFALVNLPDARLQQFKMLQSLEDPELSFVVVPLGLSTGTIAAADLDEMFESAAIPRDRALVLLIVTVRRVDSAVEMTANLRAPLVVDTDSRRARQCVLGNGSYSIRHPI
jgi:flagellar assembly factor FliW